MGFSLTPSSRCTVNVGLVFGTAGSYVAERDRFKPDTVAPILPNSEMAPGRIGFFRQTEKDVYCLVS
jgi:hypothetical protein